LRRCNEDSILSGESLSKFNESIAKVVFDRNGQRNVLELSWSAGKKDWDEESAANVMKDGWPVEAKG